MGCHRLVDHVGMSRLITGVTGWHRFQDCSPGYDFSPNSFAVFMVSMQYWVKLHTHPALMSFVFELFFNLFDCFHTVSTSTFFREPAFPSCTIN